MMVNYIFVFGTEMRDLPGQRILASFEVSRQDAEANGTLYAPSASVPVAVFEDGSGRMVRGELVQIKDGAYMAAAINALAQSQGYLGKGDPGNLVEMTKITVRPFGGDVPVKGVIAFAASDTFDLSLVDVVDDGNWRNYRKNANGDHLDADTITTLSGQASVD